MQGWRHRAVDCRLAWGGEREHFLNFADSFPLGLVQATGATAGFTTTKPF